MPIADPLLRALGTLAYPGGRIGGLPILLYHRVLAQPDPLLPGVPDAREADAQFAALARHFRVMPLQDAVDALREGRLPARAIALSFDDGYRDNHDVALPLLQRHRLTATFFVATDFLDGRLMFNDIVVESLRHSGRPEVDFGRWGLGRWPLGTPPQLKQAIAEVTRAVKYADPELRRELCEHLVAEHRGGRLDALMMTTEQVQAMDRAGMTIGGHTCSHPILQKLPPAEAMREIVANREALAALIGRAPSLFAYPNGKPVQDYGPPHVAAVREAGYRYAFSTAYGVATRQADPMQLPRFVATASEPSRLATQIARMSRHRSDYALAR